MSRVRILSGIAPSGQFHLGNLVGAIRRWVDDQDVQDAYYMIVDLHAITMPQDPALLRARTIDSARQLFAAGLDPERSTVFIQSHVHEHAELGWILGCVATFGELNRMTQFKEKSGEARESATAGLFTYPVLQAADILLYRADEVPVGDDQRQHIELTRDIAQRFNHRFGEVFTVPKATTPKVGGRVMDLQFIDKKMSKSADSPRGTINLLDDPTAIAKKVKSAVTDSGSEVKAAPDKQGVTNLLDLYSALTGDEVAAIESRYEGKLYGEFKSDLADVVVETLRPVRERYDALDPESVERMLATGATKARTVAAETLARAKDAVGFVAPRG